MSYKKYPTCLIILLLFISSCSDHKSGWLSAKRENARKLDIILYTGFPLQRATLWTHKLKSILGEATIIKYKVALPAEAFYKPRKRYLADKILDFMSSTTPDDHITLGLTNNDISIPYKQHANWGVMGLSYCPGNVSVISTYRLKPDRADEQGIKLCLHELGHAEGLGHCPKLNCLMRDANGKNHFDEMTGFCDDCSKKLKSKGWKLPN